MADIYKIGINNSMVANFLMKVDHTLCLRPHKIWATSDEFRTDNISSKIKNCHYTPFCDLTKVSVHTVDSP